MAGPGPGYHAILGDEAATHRLNNSGEEESFLIRRSDITPEKLILSIKTGGKVSHVQVPCEIKSTSDLESQETKELLDKLSLSFLKNEKPVSPPVDTPLIEKFRSPRFYAENKTPLKCDICSHQSNDAIKARNHIRVHKTTYCPDCSRFVLTNSFCTHKRKCSKEPLLLHSCPHCDYKTSRKNDLTKHAVVHSRPHECQQCHRTFDTEARLKLHETFHSVGHKCGECDLSYKSRKGLRRHIKNSHENVRVNIPGLGFGVFDGQYQENREKKKDKTPHSYMCTTCGFKTKYKVSIKKHLMDGRCHARKKKPNIFHCQSCTHSSKDRSNMHKHKKVCRYGICKGQRVVGMITNDYVREIHNEVHGVSKKNLMKVIGKLTKVIGKESLEFGLRDDLSDNMNSLDEFYTSSKLEYVNSKGKQKTTAFARVKDINAVIQEIIRGRGIKNPLVCLGFDSGQGKLVVTMAIYDRDELESEEEDSQEEPQEQPEGDASLLQQEDRGHEQALPQHEAPEDRVRLPQQEDRGHEQAIPRLEAEEDAAPVQKTGRGKQKSIYSVFGEMRRLKSRKEMDRLLTSAEQNPEVSTQVNNDHFIVYLAFNLILILFSG